jgi:hypothetical protein
MGTGVPVTSPWVQEFTDYVGRAVRITVTFNEATRAITGITTYRDAGCLFPNILIGLGTDGIPDSTDKAIAVPEGTTILTNQRINQLATRGLSTIEDITALNITAGR